MENGSNRRNFLASAAAGITLLPLVNFLSGCRQEEKSIPKKKIYADPKLELLDLALQHEFGAVVQYSNHAGVIAALNHDKTGYLRDQVQTIIADEVEHAIEISEILKKNNLQPSVTVWPAQLGETPKEMLEKDIKAEEGAMKLYEQILALPLNDMEKRIIEQIALSEEMHFTTFTSLFGDFS